MYAAFGAPGAASEAALRPHRTWAMRRRAARLPEKAKRSNREARDGSRVAIRDSRPRGTLDHRGPTPRVATVERLLDGDNNDQSPTRPEPPRWEVFRFAVVFRKHVAFLGPYNARDQLRAGLARRVREHAA